MSGECLFCTEVNERPVNVFYEHKSGLFVARWDNFPSTPGHCEVLPKRHIANFNELDDKEKAILAVVVGEVSEVISNTDLVELYQNMSQHPINSFAQALIQRSLKSVSEFNRAPDAFNHGLNDGTAAGQTIPHMHYHLMPRWSGDVDDPRGGVRHMFPEGGNYQAQSLK